MSSPETSESTTGILFEGEIRDLIIVEEDGTETVTPLGKILSEEEEM